MSKSYDIFLSHSGAQKEFVELLYTVLTRQYGQYSVFFDKDSIKHGEPISSIILENAKTCKLAVAVVSEEYFTRSKPPMLELAASYTASKNGNGVPCLLPLFFELRPEHAKDFDSLKRWSSMWEEWRRNEIMSTRTPYKSRPNKVEPTVWREALSKLLDTRGPVYVPHENENKSEVFARKAAEVIVGKLDELIKTKVSYKSAIITMSYTINVRVIQSNCNPANSFSVVEMTVWKFANDDTWIECDGEHKLTMGGSGTSGMLRFKNPGGDYFLVALGIHNYKRWCDIVPDLSSSNTGVEIHPTYYTDAAGNRGEMLWKQLAHLEKTTSKGVKVTVDYYKEDGHTLYATITIA